MSSLEIVRAFCEYNEWANGRILEAAEPLSAGDFARDGGASFGSVEGNLAHLVAAQRIWLSRWRTGVNPRSVEDEGDIHGFEAVSAAFADSHRDLRGFVEELSDEQVASTIQFTDSRGNTFARPLWQMMVHVVNHGTHHRAETAMALTALGHEPRPLDYSYFEYERS